MLKNITLSADEELIRKAREKAIRERTTLNATFRRWLRLFVGHDTKTDDFTSLMDSLNYVRSGRKFTRDEFNER